MSIGGGSFVEGIRRVTFINISEGGNGKAGKKARRRSIKMAKELARRKGIHNENDVQVISDDFKISHSGSASKKVDNKNNGMQTTSSMSVEAITVEDIKKVGLKSGWIGQQRK